MTFTPADVAADLASMYVDGVGWSREVRVFPSGNYIRAIVDLSPVEVFPYRAAQPGGYTSVSGYDATLRAQTDDVAGTSTVQVGLLIYTVVETMPITDGETEVRLQSPNIQIEEWDITTTSTSIHIEWITSGLIQGSLVVDGSAFVYVSQAAGQGTWNLLTPGTTYAIEFNYRVAGSDHTYTQYFDAATTD